MKDGLSLLVVWVLVVWVVFVALLGMVLVTFAVIMAFLTAIGAA